MANYPFWGVPAEVPGGDSDRMRRSKLSARCLAVRDRLGIRFGDESGMALVMALGIMLVLTIVLTTVIALTAAGARDSHRVNAGQQAYAVAEAGLNNALAVLNQNYPCTSCYPGNPALLTPARTSTYSTGSALWSGTLQAAPLGSDWSDEWRITSVSTVPNPTGPGAAPIRRTVTAVVPVIVPATAPIGDSNPLNFIYARGNLSFLQSVIVASPVYATQDLHLGGSATISEFIGNVAGIKNRLAVGGVFYAAQNANKVGEVNGTAIPANNLEKAYIVGGCNTKKYNNNATTHACVYGSGANIDQIWADVHGNVIPPDFLAYVPELTCCAPYPYNPLLAPAQIGLGDSTMGNRYRTADLGPRSPCTTGSVPFTFDGAGGPDGLINNSATPTGSNAIDLTPSSSYSCTSARGELSWNNATKILRVQGTVFIDGSVTVSSARSAQARITGQGALFLTGTFMMKSALLCVKTTGSGNSTKCDTSLGAWDPNLGALIVAADGDGGYDVTQAQSNNVSAGEGITLKGAYFQGGVIANKNINVDTTSEMQGPMLSVYHDVTAGQSNVLTFPPIAFAPGGGADLGPPPLAQLLPPRQFGGG